MVLLLEIKYLNQAFLELEGEPQSMEHQLQPLWQD